ncbi:MAG: hypothetical protein KAT26_11980 [Marinosulfonomonas sp.]|nr:hypothetical protein [Marinosulfonomonas sp.]
MDSDVFLVFGVIITGLCVPSIIGAFMEKRAPRIATLMVLIGSGMIAISAMQNPGGYDLQDVLKAFVRVIEGFMDTPSPVSSASG